MFKIRTTILLFTAVTFFLTACRKEEHKIRFENKFRLTLTNLTAGSADFGTVKTGETTEYKSISKGEFKVHGQTASGYLDGSGNINGKGKHLWTLVLQESGSLDLVKDK